MRLHLTACAICRRRSLISFEGRAKYPRFKSRREPEQTYRANFTNGNIRVRGNRLKLPKLGWVTFATDGREIPEAITNVTVTRTSTGKYYAEMDRMFRTLTMPGITALGLSS